MASNKVSLLISFSFSRMSSASINSLFIISSIPGFRLFLVYGFFLLSKIQCQADQCDVCSGKSSRGSLFCDRNRICIKAFQDAGKFLAFVDGFKQFDLHLFADALL